MLTLSTSLVLSTKYIIERFRGLSAKCRTDKDDWKVTR